MSRFVAHMITASVVALALALAAAPAAAFTAKLYQPEGTVEVSKDGTRWAKLRGKQRYLHPGYQVRTGEDSSARIYVRGSKQMIDLGANALVEVAGEDVNVIAGAVAEEEESFFGGLFASLERKFARSQRYTTVRRGVIDVNAKPEASLPYKQALSGSHPDLVWENAGSQYSYVLTVDGAARTINSAGEADLVRVTMADLAAGEHSIQLTIMDGDTEVSQSRQRTLVWLSPEEDAALAAEIAQMATSPMADGISYAAVFNEHRAYVAAMDAYQEYFDTNPDDIEMRSMLAEAYSKLKLGKLNQREAKMLAEVEASDS